MITLSNFLKILWNCISSVLQWWLKPEPFIQLSLPPKGDMYLKELQLRQIALIEATRIRPSLPLYRAEDVELVEEFRALEELDPLEFNSERMYEDLLAEREMAEVLQAQATAGEWWGIATPAERQKWLDKARALQSRKDYE